MLTGLQLIDIANTLYTARNIRRHIEIAHVSSQQLFTLCRLVSSFRTWPDVETQINTYLDEYGEVQDSADTQLRGIRNDLREVTQKIKARLNQIMTANPEAIQERVITARYDRFVIPVKTSHKAQFKKGILHDMSSTGSTCYIEPVAIKSMNDRVRELAARERARIYAVLRMLSEQHVAPIAEDVCNLADVLGVLDAAAARARCSRTFRGLDVKFDNSKPLCLNGVRHPLLVWQAMENMTDEERQNPKDDESSEDANGHFVVPEEPEWKKRVVPCNYVLEEEVRCVCVTGPNTGGKTITLKTIGISVLMAKAGMFIPATLPRVTELIPRPSDEEGDVEGAKLVRMPYFDKVLADIGDDQSLVQSLSTFSGHVQRIKRILVASTPKTLVLLDEIGSGTDPAEGAALGMSILRHLAIEKRSALTFATTHHGELKTLKYAKDDSARFFENASVEFDDVQMKPTFRLIWGIPGRSNALAIAERLGMRRDIVDEARFLLTGSGDSEDDSAKQLDIDKMISSLERDKNAAERAREQAERALGELQGMKAEVQSRLERLRKSEVTLRKEQKNAMDAEMRLAQKKIGKVIKEMQQGGGSAQAANRATEKLKGMTFPGSVPGQATASEKIVSLKSCDEVQIGDKVVVSRLSVNEVDVVDIVSKKEVVVGIGSMKAKVNISEISSLNRRQVSQERNTFRQKRKSSEEKKLVAVQTAVNTVDIRGERVDGAEAKVEQAIDKAIAMGTLWVIHGHGTGRLRNGIRQFLKSHQLVERIEHAKQVDGGTGVTIAYLE